MKLDPTLEWAGAGEGLNSLVERLGTGDRRNLGSDKVHSWRVGDFALGVPAAM